MEYLPQIIIALCSGVGTLVGSIIGIKQSNKLVEYRLKKLEEKQNQHNHLMERMVACEKGIGSAQYQINEIKEILR